MQDTIFQQYINSKSIFRGDRDVLRPSYIPDILPHREEQINQLASILVTALEGQRPSNVLLFGKTGTGKTACMKYIGKEIERATSKLNKVTFIYMNCEVIDTQYGILQNIGNKFIEDFDERIPFTGWSTERVYNILREKIDEERKVIVIALDEIDKLVSKSGDDSSLPSMQDQRRSEERQGQRDWDLQRPPLHGVPGPESQELPLRGEDGLPAVQRRAAQGHPRAALQTCIRRDRSRTLSDTTVRSARSAGTRGCSKGAGLVASVRRDR